MMAKYKPKFYGPGLREQIENIKEYKPLTKEKLIEYLKDIFLSRIETENKKVWFTFTYKPSEKYPLKVKRIKNK